MEEVYINDGTLNKVPIKALGKICEWCQTRKASKLIGTHYICNHCLTEPLTEKNQQKGVLFPKGT